MTVSCSRRGCAAIFLLLAVPFTASAQSQPQTKPKPDLRSDGSELFRYLLNLADVQPMRLEELWNLNRWNSDDVILVVIGSTQSRIANRNIADWLDEIARGGGAVLFLTESPQQFIQPPGAVERQSVYVNGTRVLAPAEVPRLRDSAGSPFVVPINAKEPGMAPPGPEAIWTLFDGLDRVATNGSTFFVTDMPGPEYRLRLARFPRDCYNQSGFALPNHAAFALGGEELHPDSGQGFRYIAMADQDVFSNGLMILNEETDNFELARRTVLYLSDPTTNANPTGTNRKRCLFIEHGRHVTDFKAAEYIFKDPIPLPPVPPLGQIQDKLVDAGNQIIDRLQTNDALNRTLLGNDPERQNRQLRNVIGAMMGLAAVIGTILLLLRVWGVRQAQDVPNPPESGRPRGTNPKQPAGIFDRRQRELTRRDDVSEPVRAIVREMFIAAGAPENAGPKLPRVEIGKAIRRPETLRSALADLWKLAYAPPVRLTVRRWEMLEPLFLRARRAYTDGKWRFAEN